MVLVAFGILRKRLRFRDERFLTYGVVTVLAFLVCCKGLRSWSASGLHLLRHLLEHHANQGLRG
jgi:hypothetical protein